ncbi:ankyrin repeat domain-containing protein [uncultured Legionella sp.]|uniref:ankyrin repeat domain-containing protein n=1 Tax=uncultured Legionella sp. TaxID=210934 RepID=UPI002638DCD2|nr:ankyrin repeat domain-containing protein [uncultured Legionella sp.]
MPKHLSSLTTTEIENIKTELQERLKTNAIPAIMAEEQLKLANAIKAVKYPYSVNNILVYIDKNTANLLGNSSHPLLQQWGTHCTKFYEASPNKHFVVAETGIVTTGYISRKNEGWWSGSGSGTFSISIGGFGYNLDEFHGHGVWDLGNNQWLASPLTPFRPIARGNIYPTTSLAQWLSLLGYPHPTINPTSTRLELLTPPHLAALTGDMELMKHLLEQGFTLDNKLNAWEITPLELAISTNQIHMVQFLIQQNALEHLEKVQLLAVKEGSMAMIDTFLTHSWLSHTVLEVARERDPLLFTYLDEKQRAKVDELLMTESSLSVLRTLLNSPQIPSQLLADIIAIYPELVLNPVPEDMNENTLLHQLVNTKDSAKVTRLLEAMFHACYLDIPHYSLDCERKNKQGQTVLDLALNNGVNEITSAILLYGNPKNLTLEQQNKLVASKIDIGAITRDREQRALKLAQNDHKAIVQLKHAAMDTIKEVISIKQVNAQIIKQLELQNQQIQMQQQMLHHFAQLLGFNMEPMNNSTPMQQRQLLAPDNRFFAPQQEENKVIELINTSTFEKK